MSEAIAWSVAVREEDGCWNSMPALDPVNPREWTTPMIWPKMPTCMIGWDGVGEWVEIMGVTHD